MKIKLSSFMALLFLCTAVSANNAEIFVKAVVELASQKLNNPAHIHRQNISLVTFEANNKINCIYDKLLEYDIKQNFIKKNYPNFKISMKPVRLEKMKKQFDMFDPYYTEDGKLVYKPSLYSFWFEEQWSNNQTYRLLAKVEKDRLDGDIDKEVMLEFAKKEVEENCPSVSTNDVSAVGFKKIITEQTETPSIKVIKNNQVTSVPVQEILRPSNQKALEGSLWVSRTNDGKGLRKNLDLTEGDIYYLYIKVNQPAYVYIKGIAKLLKANKSLWSSYLLELQNFDEKRPLRNTQVKNLQSSPNPHDYANESFVFFAPRGIHLVSDIGYEVTCTTSVPCGNESLTAWISEKPNMPPITSYSDNYNLISQSEKLIQTLMLTKGMSLPKPKKKQDYLETRFTTIKDNVFFTTRQKLSQAY